MYNKSTQKWTNEVVYEKGFLIYGDMEELLDSPFKNSVYSTVQNPNAWPEFKKLKFRLWDLESVSKAWCFHRASQHRLKWTKASCLQRPHRNPTSVWIISQYLILYQHWQTVITYKAVRKMLLWLECLFILMKRSRVMGYSWTQTSSTLSVVIKLVKNETDRDKESCKNTKISALPKWVSFQIIRLHDGSKLNHKVL